MEDVWSDVEPLIYQSQINVPYNWWAGETADRFLRSLRDEKKILGTSCAQCNKVFVPPRKTCPECFGQDMTWAELAPEGELITYTVARRQLRAIPQKTPVIFGLIKLDGADTSLLHVIGEMEPQKVAIGMRLVAKFSDDRQGNILDIEYFRPV
jgi:uncharacterized OB-fold protein